VILSCLSVSGPDVPNFLAGFTFCPFFWNYNNPPEARELTDIDSTTRLCQSVHCIVDESPAANLNPTPQ
jgi:hypothetical protein